MHKCTCFKRIRRKFHLNESVECFSQKLTLIASIVKVTAAKQFQAFSHHTQISTSYTNHNSEIYYENKFWCKIVTKFIHFNEIVCHVELIRSSSLCVSVFIYHFRRITCEHTLSFQRKTNSFSICRKLCDNKTMMMPMNWIGLDKAADPIENIRSVLSFV